MNYDARREHEANCDQIVQRLRTRRIELEKELRAADPPAKPAYVNWSLLFAWLVSIGMTWLLVIGAAYGFWLLVRH